MEDDSIPIRVIYQNDIRFIFLPKNQVTAGMLIAKAMQSGLDLPIGAKIHFFDNLNTKILADKFPIIVKTYFHSASFHVRLAVKETVQSIPSLITCQMLESYMKKNGGESTLAACKNTNPLNTQLRIEFIKILANYTVSLFGYNPSSEQFESICIAAVESVKTLKTKNGLGIDQLFHKNNGMGGYLYNRVRYLRSKMSKESNLDNANRNDIVDVIAPGSNEQNDLVSSNVMNDMLKLKTTIISDSNIEEIRLILKRTRRIRMDMIKNQSVDFMENFPCFFVCPALILHEFEDVFVDCVPNSLDDKWEEMATKLNAVLNGTYRTKRFTTLWPQEIENFLILIRLLPYKPGGQSKESAEVFPNAIKRFVVFSKTEEYPVVEQNKNKCPFIIACGEERHNISHYFIDVESNRICVPKHFTFVQTVDLFFKLHHTFNLNYDERTRNMFFFLQFYVYEMRVGREMPFTKMIELNNSIQ